MFCFVIAPCKWVPLVWALSAWARCEHAKPRGIEQLTEHARLRFTDSENCVQARRRRLRGHVARRHVV